MSKIIQYRMVYSEDFYHFTKIVNDMIKKGYQPYGNTFMANDTINDNPCYHQPMVKYEPMVKYKSEIKKEPRWKSWKREKEFEKRGINDEIITLDNIILKKTKSI